MALSADATFAVWKSLLPIFPRGANAHAHGSYLPALPPYNTPVETDLIQAWLYKLSGLQYSPYPFGRSAVVTVRYPDDADVHSKHSSPLPSSSVLSLDRKDSRVPRAARAYRWPPRSQPDEMHLCGEPGLFLPTRTSEVSCNLTNLRRARSFARATRPKEDGMWRDRCGRRALLHHPDEAPIQSPGLYADTRN